MNHYLTELGPHPERNYSLPSPGKKFNFHFDQSREDLLILLILFFFSVNIVLAFVQFSNPSEIVDSIPAPANTSSLFNLFNF